MAAPEGQSDILHMQVLNAGSGPPTSRALHSLFSRNIWKETRLDIDPRARPDVVGSITDMTYLFEDETFDAIWSSHNIEHLYTHEVPLALGEFRRVLKTTGFALITCPDLEVAASLAAKHGLDYKVYDSPAGPITTHDILFGHSQSIAAGLDHMGHNTGFTCSKLGNALVDAGFPTVLAKKEHFDLWALALMENADKGSIQTELRVHGVDMFETVS